MYDGKRRFRVLSVIPSLITGGAERVSLDLLAHLDKELFDATLISLYPFSGTIFEREAASQGLNVRYLSKKSGPNINVIRELQSVVNSLRPDVIHSHLYIMHYILPICIRNHIPVRVHTVHNPVDVKMPEGWRRRLYWSAFHLFGFHAVSISKSVSASVRSLFNPPASSVIYNGTDTARFNGSLEKRALWRKQHSIDPDACVFLTIARLHRQKNHALLIDAFSDVVRQAPQAKLILVGSGELRSAIEAQVASLGLQNRVLLLGDRPDVPVVLNASDVLVSASEWEGFGITVVEAMASMKPIVATAVGGVPELVTNGVNGFLVPPGAKDQLANAMLVMQANPNLACWMGGQGRQRARAAFDVREMARQYGQLYLELFDKSQRGQRTGPTLAAR
jgi:glycosyltransferase involved in cell wall biosynthesis